MKDIFLYSFMIINIIIIITISSYTNMSKNTYVAEIKGAVVKPGVYEINDNTTVEELIKKASGLLKTADVSITNLARKVNSEDVVIIYSQDEISDMRTGNTSVKYIDKECICPVIDNSSLFQKAISNADGIISKDGKISLNSASIKELTTLPGVGEKKAQAIIEYREINKGFKEIEEIMHVKGIGEAMYEKIKDYLTL